MSDSIDVGRRVDIAAIGRDGVSGMVIAHDEDEVWLIGHTTVCMMRADGQLASEPVTMHTELGDFYRRYGDASFGEDEPAYARICHGIADRPQMLEMLAAHPREAQQPNLILAAVHYLLLGGLDHPLGDVYYRTSAADPAELFADLVLGHREQIDGLLTTHRTQTNEVGRCTLLTILLNQAAAETDKALAWIDLGASAGLNLQLDHYRMNYSIDGRVESTGNNDAALALYCEVQSGSPVILPSAPPISWRIGVDRAPIDVGDADQARWLRACLWPSKVDRMQRLDAAIGIARRHRPEIIEADASAGLAEAIERAPRDLALVVTTSWVWYYLTREKQAEVLDVMRSADRRLWWFSLEGAGVVAELNEERDRHSVASTVGKMILGGGSDDRAEVLGLSHPHGAHLNWY